MSDYLEDLAAEPFAVVKARWDDVVPRGGVAGPADYEFRRNGDNVLVSVIPSYMSRPQIILRFDAASAKEFVDALATGMDDAQRLEAQDRVADLERRLAAARRAVGELG